VQRKDGITHMFGIVCGDRLVFSSSSNGLFSSFSEEKFVLTNCSSFSSEFVVLQISKFMEVSMVENRIYLRDTFANLECETGTSDHRC